MTESIMNPDKLEITNRKLDAAIPAEVHVETDDKKARAQYASELSAQFQAYVDWAIGHWPAADIALSPDSFNRSREELNAICRQLGLSEQDSNADPSAPGAPQFIPVAPMPWP